MPMLSKGRYRARFAEGAEDIVRAQRLRYRTFIAGRGGRRDTPVDADAFDEICRHVLIEEHDSDTLVGCFRLLPLGRGADIGGSYAAQYYDLSGLAAFEGPMVEMGRFCTHPDRKDPDILRVAWGAMTAYVDAHGVEMLFGCTSFPGTDAAIYRETFALLNARHVAPARWLPRVKADEVVRFAAMPAPSADGARRALAAMPPLLRSYLMMGGRVSDHAVVDRELNTLHVFTGLEVREIPEARVRALRAVAG